MSNPNNSGEVMPSFNLYEVDDLKEQMAKRRELLKNHKVQAKLNSLVLRALFRARLGRHNPANEVGFLEGSMIANPLWHQNEDTYSIVMTSSNTAGGRWVGYDYRRPIVFPDEDFTNLTNRGRFTVFDLEEVRDKEANDLTPVGLFNARNLDQALQVDFPTVDELIDREFIIQTSYGKAFEVLGSYDEYSEELRSRSLIDEPVFQVTPKGNTLVYLLADGGDTKPQKETEESPVFIPGLLRPAYS